MTKINVTFTYILKIDNMLYPFNEEFTSVKYDICRFVLELPNKNSSYELKWLMNHNVIGSTIFNNKPLSRIIITSGNYSVDDINILDKYNNMSRNNYNHIYSMHPDVLVHAGGNVYADNIISTISNESIVDNRYRKSLEMSSAIRNVNSNLMLGNRHDKEKYMHWYNKIQNSLNLATADDNNQWIKIYDKVVIIGIDVVRVNTLDGIILGIPDTINKVLLVTSKCYIPLHHPKCINHISNIYHNMLENKQRGDWNHESVINIYAPLFEWLEVGNIKECIVVYGGSTVALNGKVVRNSSNREYEIPFIACGPINMNRDALENFQDYLCAKSVTGEYKLNKTDTMHITESSVNSSVAMIDIINNSMVLQHLKMLPITDNQHKSI
jgi:hypothetical protein